jgi:predicted RNase H-like nuclease (RuvC/YqgF family)
MVDAQAEKKQRRIEKLKKRIAQHQAEIDTLERAEA